MKMFFFDGAFIYHLYGQISSVRLYLPAMRPSYTCKEFLIIFFVFWKKQMRLEGLCANKIGQFVVVLEVTWKSNHLI